MYRNLIGSQLHPDVVGELTALDFQGKGGEGREREMVQWIARRGKWRRGNGKGGVTKSKGRKRRGKGRKGPNISAKFVPMNQYASHL